MPSYFGIVQSDLENRLNAAVVLGIFDDGNGTVNATALSACVADGEYELLSYLVQEYGGNIASLPADYAADPFMKQTAVEFAIAFAIERHPERAQQAGLGTKDSYFNRASARADRIRQGQQSATSLKSGEQQTNAGSITVDGSTRLYISNGPDGGGTSNAGDF